MSPDRLASILRNIANGIDSAKRPDRNKVWLAVRSVVSSLEGRLPVRRAAVQTPGIMAKKPEMDQQILELVLSHLDVDDTRVRELVAIEDLVAQSVFDATSVLAESLAELESEYGYGFDWTEEAEEPPEEDEVPALGEAGPPPGPDADLEPEPPAPPPPADED
jgi:hypothetical protein